MDKDQIIEDFFRSLRITLTNAFSYSKDHPYFIKSVENFKLKLEEILVIFNPFKIGVTSSGLLVDGKNLTRIGFYDELARLLHQRKIKSIGIRNGSTLEELIQFLGLISLPQKEIFKYGGLTALSQKTGLVHFTIEELDYSAFLHGEGHECTDIWGYMLKEAVESNDAVKIDQLADNFGSLIKQANQEDLFGAEGVSDEVNRFLLSLRNKNKKKFDQCLNEVFLWLLRNKKTLSHDKLEKLKPVFDGLSQEEFSTLLKEGFLQEDNFDALSMQLFSKVSEHRDAPKIAKDFFSKLNETPEVKDNPVAVKKIRNLLTSSQDDSMSVVYRNTLDSLVKNISFSGRLNFDQAALKENYRYIVLSILATDKNPETLQVAAAILEQDFAGLFKDNDLDLLKNLGDVLVKRKKEAVKACLDLEKSFSSFIENIVLNGGLTMQQEFLLGMVSSPSQELNFYLDKIFTAEKVNKQILELFLRLFQFNLDVFYEKIAQRIQDMEFIASLVNALGQIDTPVTLSALEYIYSGGNNLVKTESLKAMRKLKKMDTAFLMRQLNTDSYPLKRELISILMFDAQAKNTILELLFKSSGFLGSKNEFLIRNMQIVSDLQIKEASVFIKGFSRKRFFWNRQLRSKATQILKEWNVS